ncbi:MAG: hypothetical protein K0R59_511 [Sphingobacterium sp.]|jgi:hypothetical protein|nr:hypothetical protein [Sphingobacterium sp.]
MKKIVCFCAGICLFLAILSCIDRESSKVSNNSEIESKPKENSVNKFLFNKDDSTSDIKYSNKAEAPSELKVAISDTINVKDFGAKGNGIDDDGNSFQTAINSLKKGGVLLIPEGIYLIKRTLNVKSNITIVGKGSKTKLQYRWPKFSITKKLLYGFLLTEASNVTFKNFHIDGGASNYNQVILDDRKNQTWDVNGAYHLFFIKPKFDFAVSDIYFERLELSNSFFDAIHTYARPADPGPKYKTKNVFVNNCVFRSIGCHGIGVGLINNMTVKNSSFRRVGLMKMLNSGYGSGMAVDASGGSENVKILNNSVDGAAAGFKTETHENNGGRYLTSRNITISNNKIKNLYSGSDYKIFYGIKANGINIIVKNNLIESFSHGILIGKDASDCVISGNKILAKGDESVGIRCDKNGGGHVITDNQIKNSKTQGILISNSDNLKVSRNLIIESRLDNIRIAGGNNILLDGNICANAGTNNITIVPLKGMQISSVSALNNICYDIDGSQRDQTKRILVASAQNVKINGNRLNAVTASTKMSSLINSNSSLTFSSTFPSQGTFVKGDFVVKKRNKATIDNSDKIIGWECTESGKPGRWKVIKLDF